jgi:nucleoside-diphosphate-sugar epimerase
MKIAIIGSNSFLAGYIIEQLTKPDYALYIFGRTNRWGEKFDFGLFDLPIICPEITDLLKFDVIVYCAGAGIQANLKQTNESIYDVNTFYPIKLFYGLIERNFTGKFVSFGSYFEIGDSKEAFKFTEIDLLNSRLTVPNDYCISKRIFSRFLDSVNCSFSYIHLVLPNIYGKNENPLRIIPSIIESIKTKTPISFTSGMQVRQYLHVSDIAQLVENCVKCNFVSGVYNITCPEHVQIKQLVEIIYDQMGAKDEFSKVKFGQENRSDNKMQYLLLDDNKARNELGWSPNYDIIRGIQSYF